MVQAKERQTCKYCEREEIGNSYICINEKSPFCGWVNEDGFCERYEEAPK